MTRSLSMSGLVTVAAVALVLAACSQNPVSSAMNPSGTASLDPTMSSLRTATLSATAGSTNGVAGAEGAYYDSALFTINLKEMPDLAAASVLAHNPGFNIIYEMDEIGDGEFADVIDAIPGDGMNPLWRAVDVVFNPGFTPHQFYSDDEVIGASQGSNPEISLVVTNEVYRCAVIGQKP